MNGKEINICINFLGIYTIGSLSKILYVYCLLVLAGKEESNDISYIARPFYFEKHKKETKEYWHLNFEKSNVIKTKLGFILPANMNYQELYLLDESDTTYKLSDVNDSKKNDGEELVPEKINVYIIKSLDNLKN